MKKTLLIPAVAILMASCAHDDGSVSISLPKDFKEKTLVVSHVTVKNIFEAKKQEDLKIKFDTLEVNNGIATLQLDPEGPARYNIVPPAPSLIDPDFYAAPHDNLKVAIESFDPLKFTVTGSELMDDMTAFLAVTRPIQQEYIDKVNENLDISEDDLKGIMDRYDSAVKKFVTDHPKSPVVPFAILELSGDDFKSFYDNLTPEAKKSILMPYAELYNSQVEEMLGERSAEQARKDEVASGTIAAPDFSLPDLNGKMVSLSDFRGNWVVLDFWGSWCGWCVKGFPALKDAYQKYGDRIVVIGIDCNESEADWREGVKKYNLPWLNLYNDDNNKLYEDYRIEGFPTKAIINPEGKIVDLTTGEDPSFFTRLDSFIQN